MKPLYLIDASIYIFRGWFAWPDTLQTPDGLPVNAAYGYTRFLIEFLEQAQPGHVAAAFDLALGTSFRHQIDPAYKGNREQAPPELKRQMDWCRDITRAFGIARHASTLYEADDLIGTLALNMRREGYPCVIVSADKDLAQLIEPGDALWDFARGRYEDYDALCERWGVPPEGLAELLALAGDKVDNIDGLPGVGPKTAAALLSHFGSLDGIYERLNQVPHSGIRGAASLAKKLSEHRDTAWKNLRLTTIACDAPLDARPQELAWNGVDIDAVEALFDQLGFGQGMRARALGLAAGRVSS